jgi:hypothetical protein
MTAPNVEKERTLQDARKVQKEIVAWLEEHADELNIQVVSHISGNTFYVRAEKRKSVTFSATLASVEIKVSDVWFRKTGFRYVVFASVRGHAYLKPYSDNVRTRTFKPRPGKLGGLPDFLRQCVENSREHDKESARRNVASRNLRLSAIKSLKAAGFKPIRDDRAWDLEDEALVFADARGKRDGIIVGVDNSGLITIRLPEGEKAPTFDDVLEGLALLGAG